MFESQSRLLETTHGVQLHLTPHLHVFLYEMYNFHVQLNDGYIHL